MSILYVSDDYENADGIAYIRENLSELFFEKNATELVADNNRAGLYLKIAEGCEKAAADELAEKICDVLVIGYKYRFFDRKICLGGLGRADRAILISALIAADFDDDRRYARSVIKSESQYAVDGIFNFKLSALKNKWKEITEYVPEFFSKRELKDFVGYMICEKRGRRVIVDGDKVYDRRFNRMKRSALTGKREKNLIEEILLAGAGEVEIKSLPCKNDELLLREYFGDKVFFKSRRF